MYKPYSKGKVKQKDYSNANLYLFFIKKFLILFKLIYFINQYLIEINNNRILSK